MSKTYTAWNGEEYPWPPPEGWYEASDDKWWAKDSGPGPKQAAQATPAASQDASESPTQAVIPDAQSQPQATQNPQVQNNPAQSAAPFNSGAQQTPFGASGQNQQAQFGQPQQFGAPAQQQQPGFGQPQQFGQSNWQSTPAKSGGNTGLIVGLCAGAAALVFLIGGLVFFLSRDSEEEPIAAPIPTTPTTFPVPTTPSTLATTTTLEPTTTTTEVDLDLATVGFRAHLLTIDVDASEATDAQLQAAGLGTCLSAILSFTPADWEENSEDLVETSRQGQIDAGNAAPLTRNQWRSVLDARLVFYCPDDAERLDVTI